MNIICDLALLQINYRVIIFILPSMSLISITRFFQALYVLCSPSFLYLLVCLCIALRQHERLSFVIPCCCFCLGKFLSVCHINMKSGLQTCLDAVMRFALVIGKASFSKLMSVHGTRTGSIVTRMSFRAALP